MEEATTSLLVRFECLSAKTITTNEIELPPVSTVQQIKEYFEEKHDIPVCLQTIRRSSAVLKQDTLVASLRLRHGDELHVSYYAKAECQEMRRVIRWLEEFVSCAVNGGEYPQHLLVLEESVYDLFWPWGMPVKLANKRVFVSHGGLDLTIQLHKYLLSHQWEQLPGLLKKIESWVLMTLWVLCEDEIFQQAIFNKGGLINGIKSLLRVPILRNQPIIDTSTPDNNRALWLSVVRTIEFLTGMLDISSSHMELATDSKIMRQLSNMIHCPSINGEAVIDIVSICRILTHTTETHSYLVEAGLVESFLAKQSTEYENNDNLKLLYQYHGAVFLAQIVLFSPSLIAEKENDIKSFLTQFVQEARQPSDIAEIDCYLERSLLPYFKLIYRPFSGSDVQSVALQIIIIALHVMLGREIHRDVLLREGLMDYITCMPWYTTGAAEQRARALVRMVQQAPDVDLQPPSLLNIAKACVAKNYCGLQTVVHLSVPEILRRMCP